MPRHKHTSLVVANPTSQVSGESMGQQALMMFDPTNGQPNPYPSHAKQYREYHGPIAWLCNPWNGAVRDPRDIASDVEGKLINNR